MENILSLDQKDEILGEIYVIINRISGKRYIGQTRSHRKNKNKYRRFGYVGRFKDHISEAINNTKKCQCTYLNNALRENVENFYCELLETCDLSKLDEREVYYIEKYNTLYPNGYNLTKGGKSGPFIKNIKGPDFNPTSRRGRPSGYKHSEETKSKIKNGIDKARQHLQQIASTPENKARVSLAIKNYYDDYKIKRLSSYDLKEEPDFYIKPMYKSGELVDYKIYINREVRFMIKSSSESLEEKFTRLRQIITRAKELRGENGEDVSKE